MATWEQSVPSALAAAVEKFPKTDDDGGGSLVHRERLLRILGTPEEQHRTYFKVKRENKNNQEIIYFDVCEYQPCFHDCSLICSLVMLR